MWCPKCPGKLEDKQIDDEKVRVCYLCEGIWLDKDQLDRIITTNLKNACGFPWKPKASVQEKSGTSETDLDSKKGRCPRCEAGMKQTSHKADPAVIIDICPNGHGIWLDGGEINRLKKRGLTDLIQSLKSALSNERDERSLFS
ncbi:MAG: zf-TFIIB domain-containing protein [Candidatus Aureabacteria bacterium]|nr:zf-TFIIB domain-containing protein [Candidatus Auribacterota bacterium]